MIKILMFISLTVMSMSAFSATLITKVTQVGAATVQYGMLKAETAATTKPVCAEEYTIFSFDKSTAHGRDMYSTALSALVANKRLIITYSDIECGLLGKRTLITRIDILRD